MVGVDIQAHCELNLNTHAYQTSLPVRYWYKAQVLLLFVNITITICIKHQLVVDNLIKNTK